jgi:hypothetical protein
VQLPVAEAIGHQLRAGIPDVDDERPAVGHPAQPGLEGVRHGAAVREHVGVIPVRAGQHCDVRTVGIEVARVLVGFDHECRTRPEAGGGGRTAGQR